MRKFNVQTESDRLTHVIMGLGRGYHRQPDLVEIANSTHQKTAMASGHPEEAQVVAEFAAFKDAMEQHHIEVFEPDLAADSVQDQTCPRDIGFVIGDALVFAGMRHAGRVEEIDGIAGILSGFEGPRVHVPKGMALEGGDLVLHGDTIFLGAGQRSDPEGAAFLAAQFPGHRVIAVPTKSYAGLESGGEGSGEDVLHLDCAFNPLGLGHVLIYPQGLAHVPPEIEQGFAWIEVSKAEATALATNVLSIAPDRIIARNDPSCARVNAALRGAGYDVIEVGFDAVPSTGGSFRCATLPLIRA